MVSNIGIIVPHLGPSQLAFYVINEVNKTKDHSPIIFYENQVNPCLKVDTAFTNICEIWSFKGILISTTLDNTLASIKLMNPCRKIFYVWDLEWLRRGKNDFLHNLSIYRNNEIELVVRSNDHFNLVKNYANRTPRKIVEQFNINDIIND